MACIVQCYEIVTTLVQPEQAMIAGLQTFRRLSYPGVDITSLATCKQSGQVRQMRLIIESAVKLATQKALNSSQNSPAGSVSHEHTAPLPPTLKSSAVPHELCPRLGHLRRCVSG